MGAATGISVNPARIVAVYRVRGQAGTIEARARAIALEQSVELPLEVIDDPAILANIVGRVQAIREIGPDLFEVRVELSAVTTPPEAGQLLNMLFGNTSLQDDVVLEDVDFPSGYAEAFGGPSVGMAGLREKTDAFGRALTATALKPQGQSPEALARLAGEMAGGGIDIVKDDHGLADQAYSPFVSRVKACARAIREVNRATGQRTLYAPSLSGNLDELRAQLRIAREEGLQAALIAPMVVGLPAFHSVARENPEIALLAHPSMGGAARLSPPLLIGRLFRMLGADATIFPNYGGRFSYSSETCRRIAQRALEAWEGLKPTAPMPAGGMTLERVPELLDFYGQDCILLIGGALLADPDRVTEASKAFARKVRRHGPAQQIRVS
jgi:ribulose-bisphosphate carboxylase large chain